MSIKDLFLSGEHLKRLQDVETTLLRRKGAGTAAGFVAIVASAFQVLFVLAEKDYLGKIINILNSLIRLRFDKLIDFGIKPKDILSLLVLFFAICIYFILRRTSLLLKESKEPFRYTFYIKKFEQVEKNQRTPETKEIRYKIKGSDRCDLLHHDLAERLNQRIQRFSLLEESTQSGGDKKKAATPPGRQSSHIHITGHFVVREEKKGKWVLQIMPLIRIGPPGSPATLAPPVKFPLKSFPDGKSSQKETAETEKRTTTQAANKLDSAVGGAPQLEPVKTDKDPTAEEPIELELNANDYNQVVERVYSRIATEVYAQIESDVRMKIAFFPTAYMRALAIYHEAEDFARSNTVDAYERAIILFRESLRYFELACVKSLTWFFLHFPWLLWRVEIRYQHHWARVVTGYAKCLIYRREMSALAGRGRKPILELAELLDSAIKNVELLHMRIGRCEGGSDLDLLNAAMLYPKDSWFNRFFLLSYTPLFEAQKKTLFYLYVVDALLKRFKDNIKDARERLERARATDPRRVVKDPLYLLARGLVEPDNEEAISYFGQAVDLEPKFQMARWYLAQAYEQEFRRRDEIKEPRANIVIKEYEDLLKINYDNVTALAAQGQLLWLVKKEEAKDKFEEGREIKAIASETFIGELNYRLARIAAESEKWEECYSRYMEARAADPAVAVYYPGENSRINLSDYNDIGTEMLQRFQDYKQVVEDSIRKSVDNDKNDSPKKNDQEAPSKKCLYTVLAFVLNDYGNACLRYFHYHGDNVQLKRAIYAYEEAIKLNPEDAVPLFNVSNAYGWNGQESKRVESLLKAMNLEPNWPVIANAASKERVKNTTDAIKEIERESKDWNEKVYKLKEDISRVKEDKKKAMTLTVGKSGEEDITKYRVDLKLLNKEGEDKPNLPDEVKKALRSLVLMAPLTEEELIHDIEEQIERDLTDNERKIVFEKVCKKLSPGERLASSTDRAFTNLRQGESLSSDYLDKRIIQLENEKSTAEKKISELNGKKDELESTKELESVINESIKNSSFAALSDSRVEDLIDYLLTIPWRRLDGNDVEILIVLVDLLRLDPENPEKQNYVDAGIRLAEHLLKMLPENDRIITILLETIPRRIKKLEKEGSSNEEKTEPTNYRKKETTKGEKEGFTNRVLNDYKTLLEDCKERWKRIVEEWAKSNPNVFLALLYYLLFRENGEENLLKKYKDEYFKGKQYVFENLLGNVYYNLRRLKDAKEAYSRAVELKRDEAKSHFNLGIVLSQLRDWPSARVAFQEAHRLDQYQEEYLEALASTYYEIGLSLLWKRVGLTYESAILTRAIKAIENAYRLKPDIQEYSESLKQFRRQKAELDLYGDCSMVKLSTVVAPIAVEFASNLDDLILRQDGSELSTKTIACSENMREGVKQQFGIDVPGIRWWSNDSDFPEGTYVIMLNEIPLVSGNVSHDKKLCLKNVKELSKRSIKAEEAVDPKTGEESALIDRNDWDRAETAGFGLIDPLGYILRHIEGVLERNLTIFLGHQEVTNLLKRSKKSNISVIATSTEKVSALTETLQGLVAEKVPITAFDDLCDYFIKNYELESTEVLIEEMRMLKNVREKLPGNSEDYSLLPIGEDFAKVLADALQETGSIHILVMEPELCQDALSAIRNAVVGNMRVALVVEDRTVRIHLRKLVELEFRHLPVLSKQELLDGLNLDYSRVINLK